MMGDSRMTSDLAKMIDKLGRGVKKLEDEEITRPAGTCGSHALQSLCLRHNMEGTQLSLSCLMEMRGQQEEILSNTKMTADLLHEMREDRRSVPVPTVNGSASIGSKWGVIKGPWQMVMAIAALAIFVGSIVGGMYSVAKLFLDKKPVRQVETVRTP